MSCRQVLRRSPLNFWFLKRSLYSFFLSFLCVLFRVFVVVVCLFVCFFFLLLRNKNKDGINSTKCLRVERIRKGVLNNYIFSVEFTDVNHFLGKKLSSEHVIVISEFWQPHLKTWTNLLKRPIVNDSDLYKGHLQYWKLSFFFQEVIKLFIINGFVDNFKKKLDLARRNKYNV